MKDTSVSSSTPWFQYDNFSAQLQLYGTHSGIVSRGWACPRHIHPVMFELNLVLEGCQSVKLEGESYEQRGGDIMMISPMQVHEYEAKHTEQLEYFVLHIGLDDRDWLQMLKQANRSFYPQGTEMNEKVQPRLKRLRELLIAEQPRFRIISELYMLLAEMEELLRLEPLLPTNPHLEAAYVIAKEIENRVLCPGDRAETSEASGQWLSDLARKLGMSPRHCTRIFHQAFGMSPRQYLSMLLQQAAMRMLVDGTESVEKIAYRLGYHNVASFSRQFKSWTGYPPTFFRSEHQESLFYLASLGPAPGKNHEGEPYNRA